MTKSAVQMLTLPAFDDESGMLNVIVETPKGRRNKYKFDESVRLFRLDRILPAGAVFPFDFGFVPSTEGEDGDRSTCSSRSTSRCTRACSCARGSSA